MNTAALVRALFFLQTRSIANSIRVRIRRLKQPRYLVGGVVGAAYMSFWWGRWIWNIGGGPGGHPPTMNSEAKLIVTDLLSVLVFLIGCSAWIFTSPRASLAFTEPELAFLLPAPMSRKLLIRYKLIRSQFLLLFQTVLMSVVTGRFLGDGRIGYHLPGLWLALTALSFHGIGASFTVQRLTERGLATWKRRVGGAVIAATLIGVVVAWGYSLPPAPGFTHGHGRSMATGSEIASATDPWLQSALRSGPGRWILMPARTVVEPFFAASPGEFVKAVIPLIGLVGLLFWWIERADVSFEEASLEFARKRAEVLASVRAGNRVTLKRRKRSDAFELKPTGFVPTAFLWKHLVESGITRRKMEIAGGGLGLVLIGLRFSLSNNALVIAWSVAVAGMTAMLFLSLTTGAVLGRELTMMEVFKQYPLPGWQIMLGQMAGPVVRITAYQWAGLLSAVTLVPGEMLNSTVLSLPQIIVGLILLALSLIPVNALNALVPAAAALYFPAWARPSKEGPAGFEAMGQRLILMFGMLLAMAIAVFPAGVIVGGSLWIGKMTGAATLFLAFGGTVAMALLTLEAGLGIRLLGRLFDRFEAAND